MEQRCGNCKWFVHDASKDSIMGFCKFFKLTLTRSALNKIPFWARSSYMNALCGDKCKTWHPQPRGEE